MDSTRDSLVAAQAEQYGVEVLCEGWNPLVAAATEPAGAKRGLMAGLAGVDVDTFLPRVYRFQQV
jgi:hypothetical protein